MYSARAPRTSRHFYPRPPRGGRPFQPPGRPVHLPISIHALREEGDGKARSPSPSGDDFYPRPPRGGRRCRLRKRKDWSTHFYPRPPRGGRLQICTKPQSGMDISIHALREEGDQRWQCVSVDGLGFLSTPSARRATAINLGSGAMRGDFYPRPPRGGRPGNTQAQTRRSTFLSTPSARRATTSATAISRKQRNFYPRPPRGGRQKHRDKRRGVQHFYPRPPRGGRRKSATAPCAHR